MIVSAETLAVLGSAVTILVAMFAGFGWVISRMDSKFDSVDRKFEAVERDISAVKHDLSDVKVAIARLEGPTPHLIRPR